MRKLSPGLPHLITTSRILSGRRRDLLREVAVQHAPPRALAGLFVLAGLRPCLCREHLRQADRWVLQQLIERPAFIHGEAPGAGEMISDL